MSKLYIKEHTKPNLTPPVMLCDGELHSKLNKFELTKLFNAHNTCLVVGSPGQGKSSLIISLFSTKRVFRNTFSHIFYFCPSASMASVQDSIFNKLADDKIYNELTVENLQEVIDRAKAYKEESKQHKCCLIIDDFGFMIKENAIQKLLKEIAMNRRHYGFNCTFILVQTFFSTPKEIRRLANNFIMFKISENELKTFFDEISPRYSKYSEELQEMIYNKPHEWLFLNTNTGRVFKKFDEIIFS